MNTIKPEEGLGGTVCEAWCKRWVEALGQRATTASAHQGTRLRKGIPLARVPGEGVFHELYECTKENGKLETKTDLSSLNIANGIPSAPHCYKRHGVR